MLFVYVANGRIYTKEYNRKVFVKDGGIYVSDYEPDPDPANWRTISGAKVHLDENGEIDGGDILIQRPVFINKKWDYHTLWKKIFPVGVDLMVQAVNMIENGIAPKVPQDDQFKTWEPPFDPDKKLPRGDLFQLGAPQS